MEDEPPDGRLLLGLYHGVPLSRRSRAYSGVLPDKISIFRGPITRLAAGDDLAALYKPPGRFALCCKDIRVGL